jgi:DNA-binding XRE family transcriptional regulator
MTQNQPIEALSAPDLTKIRKQRGLTQAALASIFGCKIRAIQRWEKGDVIDGRTTIAYLWLRDFSDKLKKRERGNPRSLTHIPTACSCGYCS